MWLIRSYIRLAYEKRPFPSCWGVASHPASREETAVLHARPRPGSGLQTLPVTGRDPAPVPDPAIFASAVARYRALAGLRGFRQSLYECLKARADALFELADAVLCADHAVTSLVQLGLEPEFTRGPGALADPLSAGRSGDGRSFPRLAPERAQARNWPGGPRGGGRCCAAGARPGTAGRPRRGSSPTPATAPPPSLTGSSAAPSTSWSGSPPAACSTPTPSPGRAGTAVPPAAGPRCTAWSPRASPRTPGTGRGAGRSPCPRNPNPTRSSPCQIPRSTAPSAPTPATASTPASTATPAGQ